MRVAGADGRRPRGRARRPADRFRRRALRLGLGSVLLLAALGTSFVLGALAHRQGALQAFRPGLETADRTVRDLWTLLADPRSAAAAFLRPSDLPVVYVDVAARHFRKIEAKREEALRRGYLFASDGDLVPATMRSDGRTIRVRLRPKGDMTDHLGTHKWSFRVHVRGDDHVYGMRRFSLQHPETRNYLSEWAWLENLRREGVLALRYRFVRVVVNGVPRGVYALEEFPSSELLESQGRREGVLLTLDEADHWERWERFGTADFIRMGWYRDAPIDLRRASRLAGDPVLSRERDAAVALLRALQKGDRPASEIFDSRLLGRFLALTELWEAEHTIYWNNVQFYYNPVTGRLEPIGFDGNAQLETSRGLHAPAHDWTAWALRDPEVARAYVSELDRVAGPEYLDRLRRDLAEPYEALRLALYREFPAVRTGDPWRELERSQDRIRRSLQVSSHILAFAEEVPEGTEPPLQSAVRVEVQNVLSLPVEVLEFVLDGSPSTDPAPFLVEGEGHASGDGSVVLPAGLSKREDPVGYAFGPLRRAVFHLPYPRRPARPGADAGFGTGLAADAGFGSGLAAGAGFSTALETGTALETAAAEGRAEVRVLTRLMGRSGVDTLTVAVLRDGASSAPVPPPPSVEQALSAHPFLARNGPGRLAVRPGTWRVKGDLVLPAGLGLEAGPGTVLRFEERAILLARGPLELRGAAGSPVVLEAADETWDGVVVLGAGSPSLWEHVVVTDTRGVERGGWILTGGITFHESPISLLRSRIARSSAEDGLNVLRARLEIRETEFEDLASDALDGDFVTGLIESCRFRRVGGDAIDVSGSRIRIRRVDLREIGDKGISAGEGSHVEAEEVRALDVGIAVASKDLSSVSLRGATIERGRRFGLAAYTKKREYGPGSIEAMDLEFRDTLHEAVAQTGSHVRLDRRTVEARELDVEALYAAREP